MIPEVAHLALAIALSMALLQGVIPTAGAAMQRREWIGSARFLAMGQLCFVALAYAGLTYAFLVNDFSVLYVANHSNSALPLLYRIAGVWGGHEGSLLLWAFMLSGWTVAVAAFQRGLPDEMRARVIGVLGLVSAGFLLFVLLTSNPFERLVPAAVEGRDLNPLLQDPGLILHPPLLYMGYVGFSVAFAFAVAALLSGRLDSGWARWSRPWTTAAWSMLTLGIALGSWWAYYELGWGGWWFWDPVENAALMPWLAGTALIHSLAVTEKRGCFKKWTVLLAILTFSLCLLGTFLVRSGVLTSVHAFATDPRRGLFILAFLVSVTGGSLLLYAWRAPRVDSGGRFAGLSRESLLLGNNTLLTVAAGSVLLGTLYPIALDALGLGKISVGPPYFETVMIPLMVPIALLMGVGPFVRWKKDEARRLTLWLCRALGAALIVAALLPLVLGRWSPLIALGVLTATWVALTSIQSVRARVRASRGGLLALPRSFLGMHVAHLGVAIFVAGVTLVGGYEAERDVRMEVGDSARLGGYTFRFDGVVAETGPNYFASVGRVSVTKEGDPIVRMHPEKRVYASTPMPMTEAAIHSNPLRDLYVALGEPLAGRAWSLRIHYKPFVTWIWAGCVAMAVGGALSLTDRRHRVAAAARLGWRRAGSDPSPTQARSPLAGRAHS